MSAVVEYEVKVWDGSGRPPRIEHTTPDEIAVIKEVIDALLDERTHRIEITRSES